MMSWIPSFALAAVFVLGFAGRSAAGPPLICHPFQTEGHASLPWGDGPGWNAPDPGYDVTALAEDTLRLLAPEVPVLARMETLRRATIYAARDERAASTLLSRLLTRADAAAATGPDAALALFDAGYLVESYRQASQIHDWNMLSGSARGAWTLRTPPAVPDGYELVRQALEMSGGNAEMEFAASLMRQGSAAEQHRRRAAAGAAAGSTLARALADRP